MLDYSTSEEIWTHLHELFAARSSTQIMQSRLQLATLKKGAESVTKYFNKAKILVDAIQAAGQVISDTELVVYLLTGLGTDYDSIITSLSTRPILPSSSQVLSYLMVHEARLSR